MTEADKTRVTDPEGDGTHIRGTFFGKRVDALAEDLYPVKNHLPAELGALFKTARQWEDLGVGISGDAVEYEMHPTMMSYKTYTYYHEDDVLGDKGDPQYIAFKERTVRDLREATGHGGMKALLEQRKREADNDPDLPIKNQLPEDERSVWKTANQWAELGYEPSPFSRERLMRPSKGRKPCAYYNKEDMSPIEDERARNCLSCSIRGDLRICPFSGEKVNRFSRCSEWRPRLI